MQPQAGEECACLPRARLTGPANTAEVTTASLGPLVRVKALFVRRWFRHTRLNQGNRERCTAAGFTTTPPE